MSSASWALQQAIFATLANDAALKALIGDPPRLYDAPPRGGAFPYVVFAEDGVTNWDAADARGREHALTLHVWSRGGGRRECKLITEALVDALDDAALAPSGHHLVSFSFSKANFEREGDGKTCRGRIEFRAVTEPII
jgi:hypothetical protein